MNQEEYEAELGKRLDIFTSLRHESKGLVAGVVGKNILTEDLFFTSAIGRSVDILDGLSILLKVRNLTCAGALVRLQLDNLMRVFAAFISCDREKFMKDFLEGVPIRRMKDNEGEKMNDFRLRRRLSEYYPEINEIYGKASGYIHLSDAAFNKSWWMGKEEMVSFSVGLPIREEANPVLLDFADTFINFLRIEYELYDLVAQSKSIADKELSKNSTT